MKYGTLLRLASVSEAKAKMQLLIDNGMDSCQLVYKPAVYTMEDADAIRAAADETGIEISAQFCGFRDPFAAGRNAAFVNNGVNSPLFGALRMEYLISAIPFVKRLGITDVIIHSGYIPNDPFSDSYRLMLGAITTIAGNLKANGLNLLLETGTDSPISMLRIIEEAGTGNIYVNLDTGNLIMYGYGNPVDALVTYGKYVRNTHFKDGLPPTVPGQLGAEVKLGTGHVDFVRVVKMLKELGYDRYVTIEREISGDEQARDIREAVAYIRTLFNN